MWFSQEMSLGVIMRRKKKAVETTTKIAKPDNLCRVFDPGLGVNWSIYQSRRTRSALWMKRVFKKLSFDRGKLSIVATGNSHVTFIQLLQSSTFDLNSQIVSHYPPSTSIAIKYSALVNKGLSVDEVLESSIALISGRWASGPGFKHGIRCLSVHWFT